MFFKLEVKAHMRKTGKTSPDLDMGATFVLLQQLVVELHHPLVLLELQQALAQVEAQRKTHFLQRLRVLGLSVHLRARGRR